MGADTDPSQAVGAMFALKACSCLKHGWGFVVTHTCGVSTRCMRLPRGPRYSYIHCRRSLDIARLLDFGKHFELRVHGGADNSSNDVKARSYLRVEMR